jgi:hypothetical protein
VIHEFRSPVPVDTPLGSGFAVYVRDGGTFGNDIWCVVLELDRRILHFRSDQLRMAPNLTFDLGSLTARPPVQGS